MNSETGTDLGIGMVGGLVGGSSNGSQVESGVQPMMVGEGVKPSTVGMPAARRRYEDYVLPDGRTITVSPFLESHVRGQNV